MTKQQLLHASKLLTELAELFHVAGTEENAVETKHTIQPLVEKEPVIAEVVEEVIEEVLEDQEDDLSTMTVQQLRSLAKSKGLSTKGTKKDLIARIQEVADEEEETEVVEEEVVEPITEDVQEDEEEVEEGFMEEFLEEDLEDENEDEEELDQMEVIQAELEQMSLDELKEILESVELPTKGKKQALISRILDAVEEGVIEFEEEVDEDLDVLEDDEDFEEADVEEIIEDEADEVEEDEEEIEDEEELSPREVKQHEVEEGIYEAYENGDLTDKEIAKFLEDYFNGKFKPLNKKRALSKYTEIQSALVDVDGDHMPLGEAYFVDEHTVFCCGTDVKELDNGNLYCEVCGQEYETE